MSSLDYVGVRATVADALRQESNHKRILQVLKDVQPAVLAAIDAELAHEKVTLAQLVAASE
jgi:hypothetical protein